MNIFNCFGAVTVVPYVGIDLYSLVREMKALSSKSGLPVKAKLKDKEFQVTALSNVEQVVKSLQD